MNMDNKDPAWRGPYCGCAGTSFWHKHPRSGICNPNLPTYSFIAPSNTSEQNSGLRPMLEQIVQLMEQFACEQGQPLVWPPNATLEYKAELIGKAFTETMPD